MITSKIDKNLNYKELKTIFKKDLNQSANLYKLKINNLEITIAVGKEQTEFQNKNNIVYFPIYLIKQNDKAIQIGLFEINSINYKNFLDEENDLKVEEIQSNPLIYSFATNDFLKNLINQTSNKLNEQHLNEPVINYKVLGNQQSNDKQVQNKNLDLDVNTSTKPKGKPKEKPTWINKMMNDENYTVQDVVADGNCFFDTIVQAFKSINKEKTINDLRNNLAIKTNQDDFDAKMIFYQQYLFSKNDPDADPTFLDEIKNAYGFMKNIQDLKSLKNYIKTKNFYADEWAIEKIEELYNIKFIIISSEDKTIRTKSAVFKFYKNPDYYIIVEIVGNHFKLIGYNNKQIFSNFNEIPLSLRKKIAEITQPNEFDGIPEIKEFKYTIQSAGSLHKKSLKKKYLKKSLKKSCKRKH